MLLGALVFIRVWCMCVCVCVCVCVCMCVCVWLGNQASGIAARNGLAIRLGMVWKMRSLK